MDQPALLLEDFREQAVVLDIVSPFVIIGTLTGWDDRYLVLKDADVHDLRDTTTTRELYVIETRRFGIRITRERVLVKLSEVVTISSLADVLD
ncbi:MAG: hypothetical protein HZA46_23750 [Planctomycetales bacterium]|nr:hypothetical protein [Planctomycetales bacterium]